MSESETNNETNADGGENENGAGSSGEPDWKAEAEKWKGLARKHESQAKANSGAAKELEQLRQQSMTEQEKAVAKAREEGAAEARTQAAVGRAEDAIRFAIGDRLPADELDDLIDGLNLARFVKEDGSLDRDKVRKYVDRVAPAQRGRQRVDLGQGARSGNNGSGSFLADAIRNRRS